MSKIKAFICTALLFVVILVFLFWTMSIEGAHGENLFNCIMSMMASLWMADRMGDFYKWLRKKDS